MQHSLQKQALGFTARTVALALTAVVAAHGTAAAQGSRADEIALLQADKATRLRPPERTAGERVIARVQQIVASTGTVYPWLGSVYPGGLLGVGAGFRHSFADTGVVSAMGGWSLKNFKVARAELKVPALADRRIVLTTSAEWLDAPAVAFYGLGNDSTRSRDTFAYSPASVGVMATVRLAEQVVAGAGLGHLGIGSDQGTTGPRLAPGLGSDVTYTVGRASLAVDWRDSPGYSRRGGLYRFEWAPHRDRGQAGYGFRQIEAEVAQLLPLFRGSSIVALRGLVTTTEARDGETVPVFMMPALGGGSTLRGYPSWRFRDRHRLLLSAEYRWTPSQVVDMALFVDGGKVAAERRALGLRGLHTNYGVGIRLHGPTFTALRLDLARGREGWVINMGAGAPF